MFLAVFFLSAFCEGFFDTDKGNDGRRMAIGQGVRGVACGRGCGQFFDLRLGGWLRGLRGKRVAVSVERSGARPESQPQGSLASAVTLALLWLLEPLLLLKILRYSILSRIILLLN